MYTRQPAVGIPPDARNDVQVAPKGPIQNEVHVAVQMRAERRKARLATLPRTQDTQPKVIHQFTPYGKLGYPEGVKCWCGASLEFAYHEPGQNARRTAFFDAHAACPYPESEGKPE